MNESEEIIQTEKEIRRNRIKGNTILIVSFIIAVIVVGSVFGGK